MKQTLTVAIALLLGASIAISQEAVSTAASPTPSPSGTTQVERVVVSGGEIESSETDKAQSVTILSEDNLKLQIAADIRRHSCDATRRRRERFHRRRKPSNHSRSR